MPLTFKLIINNILDEKLYELTDRFDLAVDALVKAIAIINLKEGKESKYYGIALEKLAGVYIKKGNFNKAEGLLEKAVDIIKDEAGKILRDNVWGTLDQDCYRRDFTVNALYYCPISKTIEDKSDGLKHIHKKVIVSIGDPQRRFEEDPVRSLRAIRFSNKLGFKIDNNVKEAIYDKGHLLSSISNARLFDEFCKIFLGGMGEKNFIKLCSFNLNKYLILTDPNKSDFSNDIMIRALRNTDDRIRNNQSVTPGFLIAALLWPILISKCSKDGEINIRKFFRSMDGVLKEQQKLTAVPRKFNSYIKDIWVLQLKLHSRIKSQPYKTIRHPRFRAAYDFLLVRESASRDKNGLGKWWTDFQKNDDSLRGSLISRMNEKSDEESSKIFGFYNELR